MRLDAGGESQLASLNWIMIAYSVITWMSGMTSAAHPREAREPREYLPTALLRRSWPHNLLELALLDRLTSRG